MHSRFAKYAWFVVIYNLFVILWGAFVRATGSGAGCGEHWPLCNGDVVPRSPQLSTIIEFTHRLTSGLALMFVIYLAVLAFRTFPRGNKIRTFSVLSLIFTLTEALIGAGLVLLGHVATNQSLARGWSLSLHLVNTLFLLAFLATTAWLSSSRDSTLPSRDQRERSEAPQHRLLYLAAGIFLLVGVSGAIAALGDTLFRADTLSAGMRQDLDPSAHPFVRLRVWHPVLAIAAGAALIGLGLSLLNPNKHGPTIPKLACTMIGLTILQIVLGAMNLLLLAPVWLQLLHLLAADLLWISLVLVGTELLQTRQSSRAASALA